MTAACGPEVWVRQVGGVEGEGRWGYCGGNMGTLLVVLGVMIIYQ